MEFLPPLATFYSYSHKDGRDRRHLDELRDALALSRRAGLIDDWDDRKIPTGQEWEDAIIERARQSRVFVLLITNRFIASDFCVGTELTIARALLAKGLAAVAPILAEDAEWQIEGLRDLQLVMPFEKPVSRSRRSMAWTEVGKRIREMADDLIKGKYFASIPPPLPPIPNFLPFIIGRQRELADFERALESASRQRPFVCILTGERQGQSELIENLLGDGGSVRKVLGLVTSHCRIEMDYKSWTRSGEPVELVLTEELISCLERAPRTLSREGIAESLAMQPGLSVISCELPKSEWQRTGSSRLRQFLSYWGEWPDLDSKGPMIIFLNIRAQTGNLPVQGALCLELPSINKRMVTEWLTTDFASQRFLVQRLEAHLGQVFMGHTRLCMEDLVCRVLPLLTKFQI
jgi:hypothetical protein